MGVIPYARWIGGEVDAPIQPLSRVRAGREFSVYLCRPSLTDFRSRMRPCLRGSPYAPRDLPASCGYGTDTSASGPESRTRLEAEEPTRSSAACSSIPCLPAPRTRHLIVQVEPRSAARNSTSAAMARFVLRVGRKAGRHGAWLSANGPPARCDIARRPKSGVKGGAPLARAAAVKDPAPRRNGREFRR